MKILIAAASHSSNLSGIQRHAFNMARCILETEEISTVHLVVAPWQRDLVEAVGLKSSSKLSVHIANMKQNSLSRNLWYYRQLPKLTAQLDVDVVHLTYPTPIPKFSARPTAVTLHDLYPYEIPLNFGPLKFIFNRLILRHCLRNVDAIACVSEATNTQLKRYFSASTLRKALRIYNCVETGPLHFIRSAQIQNLQGVPFLLCVAQHRHNKNILLLIRAFDRLLRLGKIAPNTSLVIIGIVGPETSKINRLISSKKLGLRIRLLEGTSEAELQWCYTNCDALVAPSITEGFGLPVAEGLLAGCRVICSDIPAHREIGEGQCRFVSLKEEPEKMLAAAIAATLQEPPNKPIPLPQFSARIIAKQYVDLYRRLCMCVACDNQAVLSNNQQTNKMEAIPSPTIERPLAPRSGGTRYGHI